MVAVQFIDVKVHEILQVIIGKYNDLHLIISIVAITMTLAGVAIGYHLGRFQKEIADISSHSRSPKNIFYRVSSKNWFLDSIYNKIVVKGLLKISGALAKFDTRIVDAFVNLLGIGYVIISFLVAWFDKIFVDGIVRLAVYTTGGLGLMTKGVQGGKIQTYIIWAFFGLIIIFAFILL